MSTRILVLPAPTNSSADSNLRVWNTTGLSRQHVSTDFPDFCNHVFVQKGKVGTVHFEERRPPSVHTWDLSSKYLRKIGNFSNLWLWHVDPEQDILVAFEIDWDTNPPNVQETKWTLTGELLDTKQFFLSLPTLRVDRVKFEQSYCNSSPHYHGIVTFGNEIIRRLPYGRDGHTIDLIYNHNIDKLSVRWNDFMQPKIERYHEHH